MKLFLIGYMGSGKTTLGDPLAKRLKVPFIDMDQLLEKREGKSVTRIFEEAGEAGFREIERDVLQESVLPDNFVMATGGGAPCFYDNMDWMNKQGITMYLRVPPEEIARRLEHERSTRPLLRNIPEDELAEVIRERIGQREKFYMQAQLIMEKSDLTVDLLLDALIKATRD